MAKAVWRVLAPVALSGVVLGFGGCLGGGVWRTVVSDVAVSEAFDLFGDDAGSTGIRMQHDDEFMPALSYVELEGFAQAVSDAK
jgi:hypothetical protein